MLAFLVLTARLVLAGVFAVAGVAKLADRKGTRTAVVAFGAPQRIAGALAVALPLAELAVAGLLLPASTALYGALGALALLALFSGAIALSLARGQAPDCHCFGQLHSAPASWKTLVRNGLLFAVGALALAGAVLENPTSAVAWIADLSGAELVALVAGATAAVVLAVGGAAFLSLMRSYGQVLIRLDRVEAALASAGLDLEDDVQMPELGLAPGTPAPSFSARSLSGKEVTLDTLTTTGLPSLLLFTSPRCGPCSTLLPRAAKWQQEHAGVLSVVFASSGAAEEVRAEADELGLEHLLLDESNQLYEAFHANGTPSAVLIAPDGTIGSWVASGPEWIEQLVEQALAPEPEEPGLPVGADAPDLTLTELGGTEVALAELQGRDTLFLFWNPECGYCRAMHDELRAWEASANGTTPRLVVVSSGDEQSTRAEGFESLVLLDDAFAAGSAFGANGTPMAVLVAADGRIASGVVAGAEAVFDLATEGVRA